MTYCVSDIHGEYDLFMRLLEKIQYSDSDRVIIGGDLIDKGAESVKLAKQVFSMPGAYCIMGNHEEMFFKFYRALMHNAIMDFDAILWRLQQYFPDGKDLDWDTVDRLTDLPYYLETDDFICVHAAAPLDAAGRVLPPGDADPNALIYDRKFKNPDVLPRDGKCVLFGHTPTFYINGKAEILTYPRAGRAGQVHSVRDLCKVHLDTGVQHTGVLGAFRTDDCQAFYVKR